MGKYGTFVTERQRTAAINVRKCEKRVSHVFTF